MSAVDTSVLGPPIKGPSALGSDPRRLWHLARTMAVSDFKLRFFGSALGYLWQLVRPLMLFGVLYVVFSQVVRVGSGVHFYPVILLSGMILYYYFSEATSRSVACVIDNENLVRKIHFPRLAIPLSTVGTVSLQLGLNVLVLFFFMLISGVHPGVRWLELPVILLPLLVLTVGVAMLLSALYVIARDVSPIWEVVTQALFYATPVLYPIELLARRSHTLAHIAMMNPLATVIQQARHALIDPQAPSAGTAIGGPIWLAIPAAITVGLFAAGFLVFNRMAPRIAEEL
jgi:ABC-2 type transport system permease protein